jgi:hypothetical protein
MVRRERSEHADTFGRTRGDSVQACVSTARDVVARQCISIRGEARRHLGPDSRVEIVLGDAGDDLVTFVVPAACGMWVCQSNSEKNTDKKKRL